MVSHINFKVKMLLFLKHFVLPFKNFKKIMLLILDNQLNWELGYFYAEANKNHILNHNGI